MHFVCGMGRAMPRLQLGFQPGVTPSERGSVSCCDTASRELPLFLCAHREGWDKMETNPRGGKTEGRAEPVMSLLSLLPALPCPALISSFPWSGQGRVPRCWSICQQGPGLDKPCCGEPRGAEGGSATRE